MIRSDKMINIIEEKVKDFHCPKCKSENIDWDRCTFTEFLDRDTVTFDASMMCLDCDHEWDALIDFKAQTMSYYEGDNKIEQDLE